MITGSSRRLFPRFCIGRSFVYWAGPFWTCIMPNHQKNCWKLLELAVPFLVAKAYLAFINNKHRLNFLWNVAVFDHGRTMVGTTIEEPHNFKFTQMREQWMKPTKEVNIDGQLPLPNAQFLNAFPSLYHEGDKLLPLRGTATEVLNQGECPLSK